MPKKRTSEISETFISTKNGIGTLKFRFPSSGDVMGFGILKLGISAARRRDGIWALKIWDFRRQAAWHGRCYALGMLIPATLFASTETTIFATDYWLCILGDEQLDNCENLEKLLVGCEIIAALDDVDLLAA